MYTDTYGEREREILNTWFHYVQQGKLQKYSIKLEIMSYSPGFIPSLSHPLSLTFLIYKILSFELSRVQCQSHLLCAQSLSNLIHGHILWTASTEMTTKL